MYEIGFSLKTIQEFRARVKRGVKFLEKHVGKKWYTKIKPSTLKLEDVTMCVLGQTFKKEAESEGMYAGFDFAVQNHEELRDDGEIEHGFNLGEEEHTFYELPPELQKNAVNPWTLLGELWIHEIQLAKHRNAVVPKAPRVARTRR